MTPGSPAAAPGWRRASAVLVDAALGAALKWTLRRGRGEPTGLRDVLSRTESPWLTLVEPSSDLVREQLGSPGQRLLGIRSVDRRTGVRLSLWRSLAMAATGFAVAALARRQARAAVSPERVRQREALMREWRAIGERHADDPRARDAAREQLAASQNVAASSCAPVLALGLLSALLRRRIAPTTEVSVRERA